MSKWHPVPWLALSVPGSVVECIYQPVQVITLHPGVYLVLWRYMVSEQLPFNHVECIPEWLFQNKQLPWGVAQSSKATGSQGTPQTSIHHFITNADNQIYSVLPYFINHWVIFIV